jgi:hypothetical protein
MHRRVVILGSRMVGAASARSSGSSIIQGLRTMPLQARSAGDRRFTPWVSHREAADAGEDMDQFVAAVLPRIRRFLLRRAERLLQFDPSRGQFEPRCERDRRRQNQPPEVRWLRRNGYP